MGGGELCLDMAGPGGSGRPPRHNVTATTRCTTSASLPSASPAGACTFSPSSDSSDSSDASQMPPCQPTIARGTTGRKSLYSIGTRLRIEVKQLREDLELITGEPGDVEFDEATGYGQAALTFKDVSFSIPGGADGKRKQILAPVSGHFEPGTLVALMGPSGSGKTSLLDILADKKAAPYEGTVHLNGRPRDKLFHRVTSYIPQDDIFPVHLTVYEVVSFYQALKVERPTKMTPANQRYFVEERLRLMGLFDVKDTKIGSEAVRGVSGGQRRRVSLACGLSSMAQIFFADEPTSGLSSTDAEACVRYMRLLAKKLGITLIVSIHQPRPEVALLFDHLLLLTANPGRAVYNGPMRGLPVFCASVGQPVPDHANPADWVLDLATPETRTGQPGVLIEHYAANTAPEVAALADSELDAERLTALELVQEVYQTMEVYGSMPRVRNTVYGVGFHRQLALVFLRQIRLSLRDPLGVSMELGVAVGQSLVIGVAYMNVGDQPSYNQALFFFMLIMTVALVGMKVMPKLIDERLVVKKETSEALYSDWAYIISFTVINTVVGLLGNSIFVVLVFWMSSCDWDLLPAMLAWNTALYLVMDSVYTMVAAIAKDATNAVTLALPFLTLFLLYNNFTVYRDILPGFMRWLLRLSPVAYSMEAVTIAAERSQPTVFAPLIQQFGYQEETGLAAAALFTCWLAFRAASVLCFRLLNNIRH